MKDLLGKEHYCYEIHTSLMKSSVYRPLSLLQKNFDLPFYDFSEIPTPLQIRRGGGHTILHMITWNSPNGGMEEG